MSMDCGGKLEYPVNMQSPHRKALDCIQTQNLHAVRHHCYPLHHCVAPPPIILSYLLYC